MDDLEENPTIFGNILIWQYHLGFVDKTMIFNLFNKRQWKAIRFGPSTTLKNQDTAGVLIPGAWDGSERFSPHHLFHPLKVEQINSDGWPWPRFASNKNLSFCNLSNFLSMFGGSFVLPRCLAKGQIRNLVS